MTRSCGGRSTLMVRAGRGSVVGLIGTGAVLAGLVFANLVLIESAWADPIKTPSALTTGFAAAPFRVGAESAGWSGSFAGDSTIAGGVLGSGSGRVFTFAIPVTLAWPLDDRTVMTAMIPLMIKDAENETTRQSARASDWGDLTLLVTHAILVRDTPVRLSRVAMTGGLRLPTGPDSEVTNDNLRLPPRMQQGLGSFGAILGVRWSCVALDARSETHAAFTYKTDAEANNFRPGDLYAFDLALGYRIRQPQTAYEQTGQVTALMELHAEHQKWDVVKGLKVRGTKHAAIFVAPGVQAILTPRLLVEAIAQYPVYREYEGDQPRADYAAGIGLRARF